MRGHLFPVAGEDMVPEQARERTEANEETWRAAPQREDRGCQRSTPSVTANGASGGSAAGLTWCRYVTRGTMVCVSAADCGKPTSVTSGTRWHWFSSKVFAADMIHGVKKFNRRVLMNRNLRSCCVFKKLLAKTQDNLQTDASFYIKVWKRNVIPP